MGQPFGTVAVPLAKDKFALDEDGVIYVRKRYPTRVALRFAGKAPGVEDMLPALIAGWRIKADGIELAYSEDAANELPVDMLEAIRDHLGVPLGSAPSANGSSTPSGEAPPPAEPAGRS